VPQSPETDALARTPRIVRPSVWKLRIVTAALVVIVTLWTCFQLKATVYDTKATFGVFDDYLVLATAAFG
jgi:hypothetical protein